MSGRGRDANGLAENSPDATSERALQARKLLRQFHAGVIATHCIEHPGYPYSAALPFCTDQNGRIVVLISHLAEHTRNIERDNRVSFTVSPVTASLQQETRASILGEIGPCDDENVAARYLRFFPEGHRYLSIGGFRFFLIEPKQVRLIAGFGSLHWLSGDRLLADEFPIAQAEADILTHMNADHQHNLVDYCRHFHSVDSRQAEMIGIDCDGFDVRSVDAIYRFDFGQEVHDAQSARAHLVTMAKASRA